ncbi:hypothetical protein [Specibacter sp. NPDC078692]|uniref:hypothetical protein n=1 Tax=Specibacter sp. NPDC078692 TaxID=3155818 RepID=UPI00342269C1
MNDSKISIRPAAPLWVPTVQQYASMSWHQRQQFVLSRRVVETVQLLIPCEKSHVEDRAETQVSGPWDEVRMHHEMTLMRRRQAAQLAAEIVSPEEGDRNWNTLAESMGFRTDVRRVWSP